MTYIIFYAEWETIKRVMGERHAGAHEDICEPAHANFRYMVCSIPTMIEQALPAVCGISTGSLGTDVALSRFAVGHRYELER